MIHLNELNVSQQLLNKIQQELEVGNRIFKMILNGVVKYFSTNIKDKCLGLQFKLYCLESGKPYIIVLENGEEIIRSSTNCCTGCTCVNGMCHPENSGAGRCGSSSSSSSSPCINAYVNGCSVTPTPAPASPSPAPVPTPVPTPTCSDCSNGGHIPGPGPAPGPGPGPGPKPLDNIILGGWNNCGPGQTCGKGSCIDCICTPGTTVPGHIGANMVNGPAGNMGGKGPAQWGPSWSTKWKTPINTILPGSFGNNKIADGDGTYKYKWITIGGEGTLSSNWTLSAEQNIINANATGCAFDMEGTLLNKENDVKAWVTKMRVKHPKWTYVYIPQCPKQSVSSKADLGFTDNDFIAPMIYYSNFDSYPGNNISCAAHNGNAGDCLGNEIITKAGWQPKNIILAFQSFDAYRTRDNGGTSLLKLLGYLLNENSSYDINGYGSSKYTLKGPFAGVIGWPAQCGGPGCPCYPPIDEWAIDIVYQSYLSNTKPEPFNCPTPWYDDSSNDNKCTMVAAINSPDTFKCIDLKQPAPSPCNN